MSQIDIRLSGTPEDVARFQEVLAAVEQLMTTGEITAPLQDQRGQLRILDRSRTYPNRGGSLLVRSYIKVEF